MPYSAPTLKQFQDQTKNRSIFTRYHRGKGLVELDTFYQQWFDKQSDVASLIELKEELKHYISLHGTTPNLFQKKSDRDSTPFIELLTHLEEKYSEISQNNPLEIQTYWEGKQNFRDVLLPKVRRESIILLANITVRPKIAADLFEALCMGADVAGVVTTDLMKGESIPFLSDSAISMEVEATSGLSVDDAITVTAIGTDYVLRPNAEKAEGLIMSGGFPTTLAEANALVQSKEHYNSLSFTGKVFENLKYILNKAWEIFRGIFDNIVRSIEEQFDSGSKIALFLIKVLSTLITIAFKMVSDVTHQFVPFVGAAKDIAQGLVQGADAIYRRIGLHNLISDLPELSGDMMSIINSLTRYVSEEILAAGWSVVKGTGKVAIAVATFGADAFTSFIIECAEWVIKVFWKFRHCYLLNNFFNEMKILAADEKCISTDKYWEKIEFNNPIATRTRRNAITLSEVEAVKLRDELTDLDPKNFSFTKGRFVPFEATPFKGQDFTHDIRGNFGHLMRTAGQISAFIPSLLLSTKTFNDGGGLLFVHSAINLPEKRLDTLNELMKTLKEQAKSVIESSGIYVYPNIQGMDESDLINFNQALSKLHLEIPQSH
jgi:hypothetical protein